MVMNIVTKHRTGRTKEKGRLKIFRRPFALQGSYMKKIAAMATAITP
jgi:hypothetical protein